MYAQEELRYFENIYDISQLDYTCKYVCLHLTVKSHDYTIYEMANRQQINFDIFFCFVIILLWKNTVKG